ncbi:MAG: uroporphyrinogen-III C-methyltransferase [Betaproteobacteria bacterium]|nr:uroporphyrinogen-III C-methyltransferase [Betaproteobacteria bacterium]
MTGTVYLVGAGPGAADLLTLRAARILERADIVFYDALVQPDTLALATHAEKFEAGKRSGRHSAAQKFINKRLIDAARKYAVVVRLKGGDPMLFGRAQEEIEALRAAHIPFEIVPGVTAASAAAAQIGVSLTRRGVSRHVAFVTPRAAPDEPANDWAASVLAADSAVIYMGAGLAQSITDTLARLGKPGDTPIGVVEDASLPGFRVRYGYLCDLPLLAAQCGSGPALIMLGNVLLDEVRQEPHENRMTNWLPHLAQA